MSKKPQDLPDPHFGTDEQMLAWCKEEGLTPVKDEEGQWDWHTVYAEWLEGEEEGGDEKPAGDGERGGGAGVGGAGRAPVGDAARALHVLRGRGAGGVAGALRGWDGFFGES